VGGGRTVDRHGSHRGQLNVRRARPVIYDEREKCVVTPGTSLSSAEMSGDVIEGGSWVVNKEGGGILAAIEGV
jgi:hypothetical protein